VTAARPPFTRLLLPVVIVTGNPGVFQAYPYPYPRDPYPQPYGFFHQKSAKTTNVLNGVFYHLGHICKAVTVTLSHIYKGALLFSSVVLLHRLVLRTCSCPQNIELSPVPSCDSSSVIPCPRQAGLHFFLNFNHTLSVHHSLGDITSVCPIHYLHGLRHFLFALPWILCPTSRGKRLLPMPYPFWMCSRHHLDIAMLNLLTILLSRPKLHHAH
jgi:hypothetical protein